MSDSPSNPRRIYDSDGNIIEEPEPRFPVMFLKFEKGDPEYKEGYRYRVDQLDEDQHYFKTRKRAEEFMFREGMYSVSIPKMMKMREQGVTY
jgi:hypothetical protein